MIGSLPLYMKNQFRARVKMWPAGHGVCDSDASSPPRWRQTTPLAASQAHRATTIRLVFLCVHLPLCVGAGGEPVSPGVRVLVRRAGQPRCPCAASRPAPVSVWRAGQPRCLRRAGQPRYPCAVSRSAPVSVRRAGQPGIRVR